MPVLTDVASLVATYATQINQIRRSVTAYARRYWLGMDSWRSADIEKMVSAIAPAVQAGQINVAALTDAYLARYETAVLGTAASPVGVSAGLVSDLAMRGVAAAEVYGRAGPTIWTALAEGVALTDATHQALVRMLTTIETDLQLARSHSSRAVLSKKQQVVGYRRVISGVKTCRLCVTASTQRYKRSELMPIHHNCVPGDSLVAGPPDIGATSTQLASGEVLAVSRRWYAGEMITIGTAAGDEFSVTPNHPVLTSKGWLPAGLLCVGDGVLRASSEHGVVGRRPHEENSPVPIEDVWRAFRVRGLLSRMPLSAEDFHGDQADGEVEIVWADGNLSSVRDRRLVEPQSELLLVGRELSGGDLSGLGGLDLGGHGSYGASGRFVGGRGALLPLVGGGVLCAEHGGLPSVARFDPPGGQFSFESAAIYAEKGLDLLGRLAGHVESDSIVHLRRVGFRGHVYNLHTSEGWYSSDNHIVSNCHCGVAPIYGTEDPGRVINLALLQSLKDSGISGELALEQSATRASKKSRSLRDQKQALRDQLDATTDPTQRSRIGRQISLINDRIDQANADVARRREQLAEYRGDYPTPEPSTIAVQHHSELGPYLTDAAHNFKSIADLNLN